jgi:haloacid dehalogenase superfamily, subfamily IA, variant 3 with third motif having DD or ED
VTLASKRFIEIPDHIKGLIFDCDGTLVDSMPLHMKAWEYALTQAGAVWDYDFFFSKKGMPGKDIIEMYNQYFPMKLLFDKVVKVKQNYFSIHRKDFQPIQPVVDIVLHYKDILPMAVASGGTLENVEIQLQSLGIRSFFKAIVTADDNVKPKPSPDIFLETAKRIDIPPKYCQVFEDGDLGLEAAKKAGMMATDVRTFL